jgi:hypothetical protein
MWTTASFSAAAPPKAFAAQLTGAAERPGPGDPDGAGRAGISFRGNQVCALLHVQRIDSATMAHIHRGAAGVAGPIVVTLPTPRPFADGCVTVTAALANEIRGNPAGFYVNVHTGAFPSGALRGQLFN